MICHFDTSRNIVHAVARACRAKRTKWQPAIARWTIAGKDIVYRLLTSGEAGIDAVRGLPAGVRG
jgi:hypothetical protein